VTEVPLGSSEAELARARQLLAAAEHLLRGDFFEDSVSRAYYAVFHAACALLASIGRTVRTHDGLRAAIAQHFVKPGHLDARYGRLLARTAADRNDADYAVTTTFRAEDAQETLERATEFVEAVAAYLARSG
jgi:uncharacterized protein (UPF0332 family)